MEVTIEFLEFFARFYLPVDYGEIGVEVSYGVKLDIKRLNTLELIAYQSRQFVKR